jgi:hypothetical protein
MVSFKALPLYPQVKSYLLLKKSILPSSSLRYPEDGDSSLCRNINLLPFYTVSYISEGSNLQLKDLY